MTIKTFLNQFGMLIFVRGKFVSILFNGSFMTMIYNDGLNLNEIDSTKFYEVLNNNTYF